MTHSTAKHFVSNTGEKRLTTVPIFTSMRISILCVLAFWFVTGMGIGSYAMRRLPGILNITSTSVPGFTVGTPYSFQLQAVGGVKPYKWTVICGSLPLGTALSTSGAISGTPTTSGNFAWLVSLRDADKKPSPYTSTKDDQPVNCELVLGVQNSGKPGVFRVTVAAFRQPGMKP